MTKQPNIIFIIADDHRYNAISATGDATVKTPVLDSLAYGGTIMSSTHINGGVDGAVCVPCRACVNTGTHLIKATKSQTIGDHDNTYVISPERVTMAEWFRMSGYATHAIGKWHNDLKSFTAGFSSGEALFFGGMSEHDQVPIFDYNAQGHYPAEARRIAEKFSTDLFTDAAIDFIEQHNSDTPYFLYLAYTSPHDPRAAPEPYASMYPADDIVLPPNYMDNHPFDNGEIVIRDEELAAIPRDKKEVRQHIADYYAMISHMDHSIGKVIDTLHASGKAEETIIVYTADHGLAVGQHALMGKQNLYEHSIRVPWIMHGPNVPSNKNINALTFQFDIFPTLCELAGLQTPQGIEGKSMKALIDGKTDQGRDYIVSFYKDIQRMVKDDRWKMIVYRRSPETGQGSNTIQLFDLQQDPWEVNDLNSNSLYKPQIDKLKQKLYEWMIYVEDPFMELYEDVLSSK